MQIQYIILWIKWMTFVFNTFSCFLTRLIKMCLNETYGEVRKLIRKHLSNALLIQKCL